MSDSFPIDRRDFLKLAVTGAVLQSLNPATGQTPVATTSTVQAADYGSDAPDELLIPQSAGRRNWLGANFWGNRLQDWELVDGRIECVSTAKGPDLRTVSLITRELAGEGGGQLITTEDGGFRPKDERILKATVGRVSPKGKGFAGFLFGAGAGRIDYRAAALVQLSSGENGGIMAVVDTEGRTSFREHTDEDNHAKYAEISSQTFKGPTTYVGQPIELTLEIAQMAGSGVYYVTLIAGDPAAPISTSSLAVTTWSKLIGGLMLVSASTSGPDGARFWFSDVSSPQYGSFIQSHPERAVGPILGTLFSLNGPVMKLTAQLMPLGESDPQEVELAIRENDQTDWRPIGSKKVGPGYCATFRVVDWDDSKDWQYRVTYADNGFAKGQKAHYDGVIRKDPRHSRRQMSIGLYSCTTATARGLDTGGSKRQFPEAFAMGRYSPQSMYFPYGDLISSAKHHNPDMLVFAGDQFYETNPTEKVKDEAPTLDYLYKYFLWLWSFREITRDRPTLVLVDDHDVYHGNLWGNNGRPAPDGNQDLGGFVRKAEWVNMVQATQCGHNPDAWDPTPVQQGIGVYYSAFKFGGVDFCLLEDRKFKTAPIQGSSLNMHVAELLGKRQEKFVKEWGEQVKNAEARICLTATLLACAQTSPEGEAVVDFDSNGYPPLARIHAVRLLRDANVLILSGDQHLASVIRLGDDTYTDGPIQFCGPAGSTSWTRWFEPKEKLANAGEQPYTGDFQDGYGNKMRVLAVANPSITFAEYRKHIKGRSQGIGDRNLKAEGYGVVKVDLDTKEYTLECWRWDVDPGGPGAKQYAGWPMKFRFDEVARG